MYTSPMQYERTGVNCATLKTHLTAVLPFYDKLVLEHYQITLPGLEAHLFLQLSTESVQQVPPWFGHLV